MNLVSLLLLMEPSFFKGAFYNKNSIGYLHILCSGPVGFRVHLFLFNDSQSITV